MWNISTIRYHDNDRRDVQPRTAMERAALARKKTFHQQILLKFKEETSKVLHLGHSLYFAETWILQKVDKKYI